MKTLSAKLPSKAFALGLGVALLFVAPAEASSGGSPPIITSVTQLSPQGPFFSHGSWGQFQMTIKGICLSGTFEVNIDGKPVPANAVNDQTIYLYEWPPFTSLGQVPVFVKTPAGSSNTLSIEVVAPTDPWLNTCSGGYVSFASGVSADLVYAGDPGDLPFLSVRLGSHPGCDDVNVVCMPYVGEILVPQILLPLPQLNQPLGYGALPVTLPSFAGDFWITMQLWTINPGDSAGSSLEVSPLCFTTVDGDL